MNRITDNNNLVKTLRKNPNEPVIFGNQKIKYYHDDHEKIFFNEYLIYENANTGLVENIEFLSRPAD